MMGQNQLFCESVKQKQFILMMNENVEIKWQIFNVFIKLLNKTSSQIHYLST